MFCLKKYFGQYNYIIILFLVQCSMCNFRNRNFSSRILQRELLIILAAFQEIQKKNIEKCERCSEIHHHL